MFRIEGKNIEMDEGDFGIELPITITNVLDTDRIQIKIYKSDEVGIIERDLPFRDKKFIFELTKEESQKLTKNNYMYKLIQYRNDIMQNTINKDSTFNVS